MSCHIIDSILCSDNYITAKMRQIWDDKVIIQHWLDAEAALAQSQAELGIIPVEAAQEIMKKAKIENLDFAVVKKDMNRSAHCLVPILREVQRKCDGNAGEYIHLGATTQDIIDIGFVLAGKKAFDVIYNDLYEIEGILIDLAEKHKNTIMTGRTHTQHALPITFGYKVAVWASEIHRHLERMDECKSRDFVGQLGGAVGSMAGFGEQAFELQEKVMSKLGLSVPDISWHVSRDRLVSLVSILALATASLGKIAHEILNLQKTEISELAEPWLNGCIGSSTMPHKRNPNGAEGIVSMSKLVKGNLFVMYESMMHEHERDGAAWKVEWVAMPEAFIFTGSIMAKSKRILKGLVVNKEKMEQNLEILKGLLLSEAVMLRLGEKLGKQTAHDVIYEISMKTFQDQASFKEYLLDDPRVNQYYSLEELEDILNPHTYTGFSCKLAEKVVDQITKKRAPLI